MQFESIFKIIIGAIVSAVIAAFGYMNKGVTENKVKIENINENVNKMSKKVEEIHWFLLRERK